MTGTGSVLWVIQGSAKAQMKAPSAPSASRMARVLVSARAAQVAVRRWSAADPPVPLGPLLRRALEQLATASSQPPTGA